MGYVFNARFASILRNMIIGLQIGKKIGSAVRLSLYAGTIGGIILFAIGLNILHEHGALF